jgi:hypothetical protein
MPDRNKHSGLLLTLINYGRKKFITFVPGHFVCKSVVLMSVLLILILGPFSRCRDNHPDDNFHNDTEHNGQSETTTITFMCFIELPFNC